MNKLIKLSLLGIFLFTGALQAAPSKDIPILRETIDKPNESSLKMKVETTNKIGIIRIIVPAYGVLMLGIILGNQAKTAAVTAAGVVTVAAWAMSFISYDVLQVYPEGQLPVAIAASYLLTGGTIVYCYHKAMLRALVGIGFVNYGLARALYPEGFFDHRLLSNPN